MKHSFCKPLAQNGNQCPHPIPDHHHRDGTFGRTSERISACHVSAEDHVCPILDVQEQKRPSGAQGRWLKAPVHEALGRTPQLAGGFHSHTTTRTRADDNDNLQTMTGWWDKPLIFSMPLPFWRLWPKIRRFIPTLFYWGISSMRALSWHRGRWSG